LQFLIKKKINCIFLKFLVIKTLDPDTDSLKILDPDPYPDPDPDSMNPDPQHCPLCKTPYKASWKICGADMVPLDRGRQRVFGQCSEESRKNGITAGSQVL
jgi:hypothetical protein